MSRIVGIDLGLAQPAVTSTNQFVGKHAWKATEGDCDFLTRCSSPTIFRVELYMR